MPGYHILAWAGMFGPAGMPPEAVKALADAIEKALNKPEVRAALRRRRAPTSTGAGRRSSTRS